MDWTSICRCTIAGLAAAMFALLAAAGRAARFPRRAAPKGRSQDQRTVQKPRRPRVHQEVRVQRPRKLPETARDRGGAGIEARNVGGRRGAGTGLFTTLLAEAVGPTGTVYAVEISPQFLAHIGAQVKKQRLAQVHAVLGTQESTNLAPESIDLAFLSDVYHHFEKPEKTLASIHRALRPGGRLAIIEFDRVEGKSSEFVLKHVRASKDVFRKEIQSAGFRLQRTVKEPKLSENFFLVFEKARLDAPAQPTRRSAKPAATL